VATCFAVDAGEDGADGEVLAAEAAGDAAAAVWRRQHAAPPPPHPACQITPELLTAAGGGTADSKYCPATGWAMQAASPPALACLGPEIISAAATPHMLARARCAHGPTSVRQRLDVAQDDAAHAVRDRPHLVLPPYECPDLCRNPLCQLLHTRQKLCDCGPSYTLFDNRRLADTLTDISRVQQQEQQTQRLAASSAAGGNLNGIGARGILDHVRLPPRLLLYMPAWYIGHSFVMQTSCIC
jgi:hypothetical protein